MFQGVADPISPWLLILPAKVLRDAFLREWPTPDPNLTPSARIAI